MGKSRRGLRESDSERENAHEFSHAFFGFAKCLYADAKCGEVRRQFQVFFHIVTQITEYI